MNLGDSEPVTSKRRQSGEPTRVFLSEFKEGLIESEEEELLEVEEEEQFVSEGKEEMGDRSDPLGGNRNDSSKEETPGGSTMNILIGLARGKQQVVDLMTQLLMNNRADCYPLILHLVGLAEEPPVDKHDKCLIPVYQMIRLFG